MYRILVAYCASFIAILDSRLDMKISADPKYSFVIYNETIISGEVITYPAVPLVGVFFMDG
jgi:hypothetical protein